MEHVGTNIRTARRLRRWTQAELARRAGVSRPAVNRAEQGLIKRISILQAIADALDADLGALLASHETKGRDAAHVAQPAQPPAPPVDAQPALVPSAARRAVVGD